MDKGCVMPSQRCKTNTSRPCKHCREAMRAPSSLCVSSSVSVPPPPTTPPFRPFFFSLLLTFVSHSSTFVQVKRAINQTARESRELRVAGLCWFKHICGVFSFIFSRTKVNLVNGVLWREKDRAPPPASPASCLFPVQTALLAKPLLPHHDPLTPALAPRLLFFPLCNAAVSPSLSLQ